MVIITSMFHYLQDLVEKVMILRKAVELSRGQAQDISGGALADKLNQYSNLLAAQGSLDTAFSYLGNSTDVSLNVPILLNHLVGKQMTQELNHLEGKQMTQEK